MSTDENVLLLDVFYCVVILCLMSLVHANIMCWKNRLQTAEDASQVKNVPRHYCPSGYLRLPS